MRTDRLEASLISLEHSLGRDHSDTVRARHRLAHAQRAAKRFDEALKLFEGNVASCTQGLGLDHLTTLRRRSSLANCFYAAGRYQQAIPLFEEILRAREVALGPNHPRYTAQPGQPGQLLPGDRSSARVHRPAPGHAASSTAGLGAVQLQHPGQRKEPGGGAQAGSGKTRVA